MAELNQIKRLIYGSKSEGLFPQILVHKFRWMEVESPTVIVPPAITTVSIGKEKEATTPMLHPGRRPFPSHLPRVEVVLNHLSLLPDSDDRKKLLSNWNMNLEDYL
ncbi:MAG: transposase [Bacteroidetes bacterium]|nr:transposase [Bacteroidota bacterium]